VQAGTPLQSFLCNRVGIDPDYLDKRVQTVFLNGKAVDDFHTAIIRNGDVLALSGAMPGLAGATLRRGGYFGRMRGEISHIAQPQPVECTQGLVKVKLFNLIVKETGPLFLQTGIVVGGEDFLAAVGASPDRFLSGCLSVQRDGSPMAPERLLTDDLKVSTLLLTVSLSG